MFCVTTILPMDSKVVMELNEISKRLKNKVII